MAATPPKPHLALRRGATGFAATAWVHELDTAGVTRHRDASSVALTAKSGDPPGPGKSSQNPS